MIEPHFHKEYPVEERDLIPNGDYVSEIPTWEAREGTEVQYLNGSDFRVYRMLDGTWREVTSVSASSLLKVRLSTLFETSGRFSTSVGGSGSTTFGASGLTINTGATGGSYARGYLTIGDGTGGSHASNGSPTFGVVLQLKTIPNVGSTFHGIGNCVVAGTGHDYTQNHIGFKLVGDGSGTATLYATVGDGVTETASAALLTGVNVNDVLDLAFQMNENASVDFYCRLNGAAQSAAITLSTHIPSLSFATDILMNSISNNSTAQAFQVICTAMNYER
jgi:hypothetical protein